MWIEPNSNAVSGLLRTELNEPSCLSDRTRAARPTEPSRTRTPNEGFDCRRSCWVCDSTAAPTVSLSTQPGEGTSRGRRFTFTIQVCSCKFWGRGHATRTSEISCSSCIGFPERQHSARNTLTERRTRMLPETLGGCAFLKYRPLTSNWTVTTCDILAKTVLFVE